MTFDLFHSFVLWLKKIFYVRSKPKFEKKEPPDEVLPENKSAEVIRLPEDKSVEVAPAQEKPRVVSPPEEKLSEVLLPEEKSIEVVPLLKERLIDKPSAEELVEAKPPEEKTPEALPETLEKELLPEVHPEISEREISSAGIQKSEECIKEPKTAEKELVESQAERPIQNGTKDTTTQKEGKDMGKTHKPYTKKPPTEEIKRQTEKPPITERKPSSTEQRKTIYLGDTSRRRRRLAGTQRELPSDENIDKEVSNKTPEEEEFATTIEAPFVEIDIDEAKVYLVLPQQQFKSNTVEKIPQQLSYSLDLNGKQREVPVKLRTDRDRSIFVEEKRIPLEEPLAKFQVTFPVQLQIRKYYYSHSDKGLYPFVAIGNNRGRMFYLHNEDGDINPLPKRVVWVLLHEEFELQTRLGSGDITEERWIWGKYKPFRIDLSEIDALVIKNRISGEEKSFALQSTYRVEGEQLIEDDYKKECPLFAGKTIKIVPPRENPRGWNIWIQNKAVGGQVISKNWIGNEPLTLNCPGDLQCDCGEFQIDICQQDTRIPDETLFFRLMPYIQLSYPKELVIPDPKLGHSPLTISIKLDGNDEWELEAKGSQKSQLIHGNLCHLELPPEKDTLRFSIAKHGRPETIVNLKTTIPRLKWKTSKLESWDWRLQKMERKRLKSGEPFYLLMQTNDFDNIYDFLALLETNGQKLQEGRFIRKGLEYILELNQFFDTIKHNEDELTMRVEIRKVKDLQLLGTVETLCFGGERKVSKKIPPPKPRGEAISKIPNIQAVVRCPGLTLKQRKGKGFSEKEVIGAGLHLKEVCSMNISYDRRRKSSHPWNIKVLKTLKNI